jgi:hypothetical protein
MTRPEIPINWEKVDELLMCGSPGTEIANFFGMHEDTFYRRTSERYNMGFSEYAAKKKSTGEALLRLHQHQKALGITKKGDNTLLIYLGKVRLGQKENANEVVVSDELMKSYQELMRKINDVQENKSSVPADTVVSIDGSSIKNPVWNYIPSIVEPSISNPSGNLNSPVADDQVRSSVFL